MRGSVSSTSEMMVGAMYLEEGLVSPPTTTFPRVDWSTFCKRLTGREEEGGEGRGGKEDGGEEGGEGKGGEEGRRETINDG